MYAEILEAGAVSGAFGALADPRGAARNLVALEDGYGVYVLTGQVAPEEVERLLLDHAALVTGAPRKRLVPVA